MRSRSRVRPQAAQSTTAIVWSRNEPFQKNGYGDLKQAGYRHPELEVLEIHVLVMAFWGS